MSGPHQQRGEGYGCLVGLGDLKEGREAADGEIPLLEYAPDSEHAQAMRDLAKELAV